MTKKFPIIGSRWKRGHIERRDTETGVYEAINSPLEAKCEAEVQRALLAPMSGLAVRRVAQAMSAKRVAR